MGTLVWDAYIDAQARVYVIDLAPFHDSTDPILFSWPELQLLAGSQSPAEMRLVEEHRVQPSAGLYHGVPWDLQQSRDCDSVESLVAKASRAAQSHAQQE